MSFTTTSLDVPAHRSSLLVRRRVATYFVGGVEEIPGLVGLLPQRGIVHELSVDIRDGVKESSMVCTIMLPGEEIELLLTRLRELPAVVSSELV